MSSYKITGGIPLKGTVTPSGNKNAALPLIAASILTDEKIILRNVPKISDVGVQLRIVKRLGGIIKRNLNEQTVEITVPKLLTYKLAKEDVIKTRGSILFLGSLVGRAKAAQIWSPGGCSLGKRPVDSYLAALQELNAKIDIEENRFTVDASKLKGGRVWLEEKAVTGTENVIMAAVLAKGHTEIINAACEPHVQDLCNMLNQMGAQITGIGSDRLEIEGVEKLHGTDFAVGSDFMEIGTYIAAAAITGGEITIKKAIPEQMTMILKEYSKLGVKCEIHGDEITVKGHSKLKIRNYLDGTMNKLECLPWPAFPPDLLQFAIVLATQADGKILIHDKLYEGRLFYTEELRKMGADIFMADPHRIVVSGPRQLRGKILKSPDIRAGMSLVIAALAAEGESIIEHGELIERGYSDIQENFSALGAKIERIA